MIVLPASVAGAQEKKDPPKTYAELVGTYQGDMNGQPIDLVIEEVGGKLQGAPTGETPVELVPVDGKELTFTADTGNGRVFTVVFVRDDKKVVTGLTATSGDQSLVLAKVK
jgi:hypothetical protein